MKAIFRSDASPEIGSGHIYRSLTLADELLKRGWECAFLCAPGSEDVVPALKDQKYGLARGAVMDLNADILIVDHYGLDADFESSCRAWAKKIVVIDDLADRDHDCDILIDQSHGRDARDYRAFVPAHCRVLAGASYALLRPQFAQARAGSLARRRTPLAAPAKILVSLGSTNIGGVTEKVLISLENVKNIEIYVVLGANAPGAAEVKGLATRIGARFHESVTDMAGLMAQADICIGAGGTTSWERCCLGLPTFIIEIADNQRLLAANLHKSGAAENLGRLEEGAAEKIPSALEALLKDPDRLIRMSERAAAICDGLGAERVAEALINDGASMVA